jgi:DNA/RNA-binding domain of Phe-tRNA-synthetase-like protein
VTLPAQQYWIDPKTYELGVRVEFAVIRGVQVHPEDPELERWRRPIHRSLRSLNIEEDPILLAYRRLLRDVGNPVAVASPEYLLRLIQKHGRLPTINAVVDAYNIISADTRAVVSAHDHDRLTGPLRMVLLDEPATFEPLGRRDDCEVLPPGEFTIRDDSHALCRLNCKQSRLSSVGPGTRNLLLYAQGNPALEEEALRSAMDAACDAIIRFAGGHRETLERIQPSSG